MGTMTIDLAPMSGETERRALRWLKARDGGKLYGPNGPRRIEALRPTGDERADRIAEVLAYAQWEKARGSGKFDMDTWHFGEPIIKTEEEPPPLPCGTACCLAGTAAAFYMPVGYKLKGDQVFTTKGRSWKATETVGREELGLSEDQALFLFYMTHARVRTIQLVTSLMTGRELTGDLSAHLSIGAKA